MVAKKQFKIISLGVAIFLLGGLGACSGNVAEWFAPDAELQENETAIGTSVQNSPDLGTAELPGDFPTEIPIYENAELFNVAQTEQDVETLWVTSDSPAAIKGFYETELNQEGWELTDTSDTSLNAQLNNLEVAVSILPEAEDNSTTNFSIRYQSVGIIAAEPAGVTRGDFTDLDEVPQPLETYIQDLAELGVLRAKTGKEFKPNENISRRDFARWLININNSIYRDRAGQQIRPVSESSTPAFSDVPESDPDFGAIQGLAEAGIIPSRLTGATDSSLFRPDAPLNRETLLAWKVPFDVRKGLPTATVDSVKETWGFQDTSKIDPKSLPALLSDYESGEQGNLRRVFGYTTLFQPDKPVTRAEAAATLWYFGTPGEGRSAKEAKSLREDS